MADDATTDDATPDDDSSSDESRSLAPIVVSVVAVALAAVHVAFPSLKVDGATLGLLAVAALPWMAPFLKSVTLPGGFEVVLQDIRKQVGHVQAQVDESTRRVEDLASTVRELLFEGEPVAAEQRTEISAAVADFRAFLADRGLPVPPADPVVRIEHDVPYPYYVGGDPPEIVIGPDASPSSTVRLYAHHVVGAVYRTRAFNQQRQALHYGLVAYFTASYEGAAAFGEALTTDQLTEALAKPVEDHESAGHAGYAWAQLFWELRELRSPDEIDRFLATAWVQAVGRGGKVATVFLRQLLEVAHDAAGEEASTVLHDHLHARGVMK